MKPIPYWPLPRFSDWLQGRRDGRREIPAVPEQDPPPPVPLTPHREALVRAAQDVFERERLAYEAAVARPAGRLRVATARRKALEDELAAAERRLAEVSRPPSAEERTRRRLGEERRDDRVVVARRLRDHKKEVRRAEAAVAGIRGRITEAEAEMAAAAAEIEREHLAAAVRVRRYHQYTHRRLATYRRSLIRVHPHGARVNELLGTAHPEIPGWAFPVPPAQDGPRPRDPLQEVPEEEPREVPEPLDDPPRIITLEETTTVFGAEVDEPHVRLDSPVAAPRHFSLTRERDGVRLRVRGHGHGPYINGRQVASAFLRPGDHFDFAGRRYTVLGDREVEDAPLGDCDLIVDRVYARSGHTSRLTGMSFVLRERQLLAIVGPSGAGKSSLFAALLGELAIEPGGRLFFRGADVTADRGQIRDELGFVPQEADLHRTLTVRRLLRFAFGLRSPAHRARREARIEEVCERLGLSEQLDQLVGTLSGGQRRRVSIALELLTEPRLLMLDEPASGLDAAMDREIMMILRRYAAEGNTVVVVTHATEHLTLAHRMLVVAGNGRPVFCGPPRAARDTLDFGGYAELMRRLIDDPSRDVEAYARGEAAAEARREADRAAAAAEEAPDPLAADETPLERLRRPGRTRQHPLRVFWRQLRVLLHRQCALVMARGLVKNRLDRNPWDRARALAVALMPLIIATVSALVAVVVTETPGLGTAGPGGAPGDAGPVTLSLLTTLCVLGGQALTYSDIVSEFPIIRREHRTGTGVLAVTLSKWLVFSVIAVLQAALIGTVFWVCGLGPDHGLVFGPVPDLIVALAALSVAAMSLGMLVSALARRLEQAVMLVTAVSVGQIAFNGVTADLSQNTVLNLLAWPLPDRWGLAAAAASVDLRRITAAPVPGTGNQDALWRHDVGQWLFDLGVLGGLSLLCFAGATWVLHRRLRPAGPRNGTKK